MKRVLLIVILAGLVAAGFFLFENQSKTTSPTSSTDSPTKTPALLDQDVQPYFSVQLPQGFKRYMTVLDDDQELFAIEDASGAGMQVFVIPYDEAGPITEERIHQDEPDTEINEPGQAKLDGVVSFLFYGFDDDLGETFEVWSIHDGNLFQIMGKKSDEKLIEQLLNTWKWK